jgi:hypothetical protein
VKPILATLILTELALAVLLVMFVFIHTDSPSLARAWGEYRAHPSPETEAAFKEEKSATDRRTFALNACVGLLLAFNSYALFKTTRKVDAGSKPGTKPITNTA